MWIIWGITTRVREEGQGLKGCVKCGRDTIHLFQSRREWFTLFFIPVFPIGRAKVIGRCDGCGQEGIASEVFSKIPGWGIPLNRRCPECAEFIHVEARVCRYCGHRLTEDEREAGKAAAQEESDRMMEKKLTYERSIEKKNLQKKAHTLSVIAWVLAILAFLFLMGGIANLVDSKPKKEMSNAEIFISTILFVGLLIFFAWRLFRKACLLKNRMNESGLLDQHR